MIISHKHKFIFLKTNKTAGTSIEIALSKFCGDEDIITPISPEDERVRQGFGYRGPQNHGLSPISDYGLRDFAVVLLRRRLKHKYYNHISATEVRRYIGEEMWNDYFKFCFERNPWDRFISFYYWRCRQEPRPTISEFLESKTMRVLKERGFDLYTINGEVAVDRVCLYENLAEELRTLRSLLGLPDELVLPRTKSTSRKDKKSYRDIFNEDQKARIGELFAEEIRLFGYQY